MSRLYLNVVQKLLVVLNFSVKNYRTNKLGREFPSVGLADLILGFCCERPCHRGRRDAIDRGTGCPNPDGQVFRESSMWWCSSDWVRGRETEGRQSCNVQCWLKLLEDRLRKGVQADLLVGVRDRLECVVEHSRVGNGEKEGCAER